MMYNLNVKLFTKEEVKGTGNKTDPVLFVEGKSPKGSVSFMCLKDDAKKLYDELIYRISTFIETNQASIFENFEEMKEEKCKVGTVNELKSESTNNTSFSNGVKLPLFKSECKEMTKEAFEGLRTSVIGQCNHIEAPDMKAEEDKNPPISDSFDPVTSHYCEGRKYEPRKVVEDWDLSFYLGNVVMYLSRAGRKGNTIEDLKKAAQYLNWEIERLETIGKMEEENSDI